jgi:hypothetical protein
VNYLFKYVIIPILITSLAIDEITAYFKQIQKTWGWYGGYHAKKHSAEAVSAETIRKDFQCAILCSTFRVRTKPQALQIVKRKLPYLSFATNVVMRITQTLPSRPPHRKSRYKSQYSLKST